ncbi:hypothetical protein J6590_082543 [Homalodisca vitripennis]|nr:hypothetical protein J6590_082543 [Homalodisca vitripennis]
MRVPPIEGADEPRADVNERKTSLEIMIAEGLAHVLFSQLKEEDKLRNLNWDILYAGSSYILKNEEFSLLQPLSCFVKFITKDEAIKV